MGNDNAVMVMTLATSSSHGNNNNSAPCSPRCNGVGADNRMTRSLIDWDSLSSPTENKPWSKSNRSDMMKSFTPTTIAKVLRGVTTAEQIV